MSQLPPPPFTPPSIEKAVQDSIDVVHQLRELRGDVNRLSNAQTVDRLTLGRLEKYMLVIMKHVGAADD